MTGDGVSSDEKSECVYPWSPRSAVLVHCRIRWALYLFHCPMFQMSTPSVPVIKKKGESRAVNVSDLISAESGRLQLAEALWGSSCGRLGSGTGRWSSGFGSAPEQYYGEATDTLSWRGR